MFPERLEAREDVTRSRGDILDKIHGIRSQLARRAEESKTLKADLDRRDEDARELARAYAEAERDREALKTRVRKLEEELEALREERDRYRAEAQSQTRRAEILEAHLTQARAAFEDISGALRDVNDSVRTFSSAG